MTKVCTKCGVEKPLDDFYKRNGKVDHYVCKVCLRAIHKERYRANKKRILESQREYYKKNKKAIIKRNNDYRERNQEVCAERARKYREANRETLAAKHHVAYKRRYAENPHRYDDWKINNPEKRKEVAKRCSQNQRDELRDCYIKQLLTAKTTIKRNELPDDLVGVKREHLRLKRRLKEIKDGTYSYASETN
jgi:hypothetical protein